MTRFEQCLPQRFCFCSTLDTGVLIVGISGLVTVTAGLIRTLATGDQNGNVYYGYLLWVIACSFLIVAARTKRRGFCWPYLIFFPLLLIGMVIGSFLHMFALDALEGFMSFIIVGLHIYFLLVVIQYYRSFTATSTVASSA